MLEGGKGKKEKQKKKPTYPFNFHCPRMTPARRSGSAHVGLPLT
ncbi:hypothetical protein IC575_000281 [Cucumis melo]